jgi:hypothetical protein
MGLEMPISLWGTRLWSIRNQVPRTLYLILIVYLASPGIFPPHKCVHISGGLRREKTMPYKDIWLPLVAFDLITHHSKREKDDS